jgi:hypothetical protein
MGILTELGQTEVKDLRSMSSGISVPEELPQRHHAMFCFMHDCIAKSMFVELFSKEKTRSRYGNSATFRFVQPYGDFSMCLKEGNQFINANIKLFHETFCSNYHELGLRGLRTKWSGHLSSESENSVNFSGL